MRSIIAQTCFEDETVLEKLIQGFRVLDVKEFFNYVVDSWLETFKVYHLLCHISKINLFSKTLHFLCVKFIICAKQRIISLIVCISLLHFLSVCFIFFYQANYTINKSLHWAVLTLFLFCSLRFVLLSYNRLFFSAFFLL